MARTTRERGGHKKLRIAVVLACIVIIVGGAAVATAILLGGGRKEQSLSPREFEARTKVTDQASKMYWDARKTASEQDATEKTIDWLKQQDSVKEAILGTGCIGIVFKNGTRYLIMTTDI